MLSTTYGAIVTYTTVALGSSELCDKGCLQHGYEMLGRQMFGVSDVLGRDVWSWCMVPPACRRQPGRPPLGPAKHQAEAVVRGIHLVGVRTTMCIAPGVSPGGSQNGVRSWCGTQPSQQVLCETCGASLCRLALLLRLHQSRRGLWR